MSNSKLSPRLGDIRFRYDLFSISTDILDDDAFRALIRLVKFSAAGMVWTYSPPGDGSLPNDNQRLSRIVGYPPNQWLKIRPMIECFFVITQEKWRLREAWIEIGAAGRASISSAIGVDVAAREGRICTYCGSTEGPLELDHIYPVSKGGRDDASNLTLACKTCNRSKGAKTLMEWVDGA